MANRSINPLMARAAPAWETQPFRPLIEFRWWCPGCYRFDRVHRIDVRNFYTEGRCQQCNHWMDLIELRDRGQLHAFTAEWLTMTLVKFGGSISPQRVARLAETMGLPLEFEAIEKLAGKMGFIVKARSMWRLPDDHPFRDPDTGRLIDEDDPRGREIEPGPEPPPEPTFMEVFQAEIREEIRKAGMSYADLIAADLPIFYRPLTDRKDV
jgi:hypothetical protein